MIKSHVVSLYGIDGLREHYMPGNRRKGTGVREKKAFESEAEARAFLEAHRGRWDGPSGSVYVCGVCGKWHTASPKRR